MDTWMFFKWIFKTFIAIYLVTHTFDITIAVFDMAQHVVQASGGGYQREHKHRYFIGDGQPANSIKQYGSPHTVRAVDGIAAHQLFN